MSNKIQLRSLYLKQRKSLIPLQVSTFSKKIVDLVTSHELFKLHKVIALYLPIYNEVNLTHLLDIPNKQFILPCIQANNTMLFKPFSKMDTLSKKHHGILEPSDSLSEFKQHIDLCLMPLVGFNRQGHRIGMGGGYYDRYFANNSLQQKPTILAGIAYDFQESDTIIADPWDIPLDIIFTNKEVILP